MLYNYNEIVMKSPSGELMHGFEEKPSDILMGNLD